MVEKWEKVSSEPVSDHFIFRIRRDESRSPRTGKTHSFFIMESDDWVNVIPITPEGNVVFIRQYRHGTGEISLEIPGGISDQDDTTLAESAGRELREETGFDSVHIIPIGSVTSNPAFLTNRCHTFLALDAYKVGQPELDEGEDIEVVEYELPLVPELISSGQISHVFVIAAFYHFENFCQKHPDWRNAPAG